MKAILRHPAIPALLILIFAGSVSIHAEPLEVTAADLVSKVYGLSDISSSREVMLKDVASQWAIAPEEEDCDIWIDSDEDGLLDYRGISPRVSMMVRYDGELPSEQYIFFIFPFEADNFEDINRSQAEFTGSLLQELYDNGLQAGIVTPSEYVFEIEGDLNGIPVRMRLDEEILTAPATALLSPAPIPLPGPGRFILTLHSDFTVVHQ
ncbi:MAG: hypothetical protein NC328_02115 [Muribaculum sp.]|nr:hypothetical protein [Muribaculum sp.]